MVFAGADLHVHHRLQHHRLSLAHRRDEGLLAGGDEGDLLAVDAVVLAVDHRHPHVDHRVAGDHAGFHRQPHAFFDRRDELARDRAALDHVDELEARTARQRLDLQMHLAELAGTAALLLVAELRLRRRADGFAEGDARRRGIDLDVIGLAQPFQQHPQMQLAQAVDDGFMRARHLLDPQARVFGRQLGQHLGQALLVTVALGLERQAVHRHREVQRLEVDVIVFGSVVQHRVVGDLVDLGHRHDVARQRPADLHMLLALQHEQVADLERLAAVAHIQLAVGGDGALVDPEDAHLAHVRVDRHLEHMREHVLRRIDRCVHQAGCVALALVEIGPVALARVGQQLLDHVEQLRHAGTGLGRDEQHRDQMALAQRLLQRRVQFARRHITIIEVALYIVGIDLDHLLDQRAVRRGHRREIGLVPRLRLGREPAIDHLAATRGGQVQRQAFTPERGLDLRQHIGQLDPGCVDAIDDDDAVERALGGVGHHAQCHRLDAGGRVDHDRRGLHRLQRGQRLTEEVGVAGGVEQVDAGVAVLQVHHAGAQRMLHAALDRVEVADRAATLDAAHRADHAGLLQQRLGQAGLAGGGRADQRQGPDRQGGRAVGGRRSAVG